MWIIKNNIIPFKGYLAITIWPFVFARKELGEVDINHESIHCCQQIEVMIMFAVIIGVLVLLAGISPWWFTLVPMSFYLLYGIEYVIRYLENGNGKIAYRRIAFEQEAYDKEGDLEYLKGRKWFTWISYY